jgi:hypothetical protein
MDYNKKRHLKLLKRLLYTKKRNKNFYQENPENYSELRKYEIIIYDHIFWTRRKNFVLLIENFIDNIIDFEKFEDVSNFDDFQFVVDTHFFSFYKTNYRKYFSFFLPDFSRNPAKNISPNFRQNH